MYNTHLSTIQELTMIHIIMYSRHNFVHKIILLTHFDVNLVLLRCRSRIEL